MLNLDVPMNHLFSPRAFDVNPSEEKQSKFALENVVGRKLITGDGKL